MESFHCFLFLLNQVIPVGKPGHQDFLIIDKGFDGKIYTQKSIGVTYIPLTDKDKQWPGNA